MTITLPPNVHLPEGHPVRLAACVSCGKGTFRGDRTRADYPLVRDTLNRAGFQRLEARGLCSHCYMHFRSMDALDQFPRLSDVNDETASCPRCGLEREAGAVLCTDCSEVANDLHELEVWA